MLTHKISIKTVEQAFCYLCLRVDCVVVSKKEILYLAVYVVKKERGKERLYTVASDFSKYLQGKCL